MSECWTYCMYSNKSQDPSGDLLYVGISDSPSSRMGNHESQKWWWWLVDNVIWNKCYTREEAEKQETNMIQSLQPLFNRSQSNLSGWDRLSSLIYLLWAHSHNPYGNPTCPFCDSHGRTEILSQDGPCQLFRRNSDDRLVIHFATSCGMHGRVLQWAVHVPALKFLSDFGCVPDLEIERMWCAASSDAPWERRIDRMPTLAEMVESGTAIRSVELMPALEALQELK
jgi:hypothetical protein